MIRRRVFYSGRVQGVGFRFTARDLARQFPITGWVRNLPDGRVELLAEGAEAEVQAFLARLGDVMGRNIHSTDQHTEAASGEFTAFEIVE